MSTDLTEVLGQVTQGDERAVDRLLQSVYPRLRALAQNYLERESPDHTLQATALVHEAYLKLVDQQAATWQDRAHFFAVAAQAMRRILVDHARGKKRAKRGGPGSKLTLNTKLLAAYERQFDLVELDDALNELASFKPQAARIVELRFFAGSTIEQTATVLGMSESTVERTWRFARAWLYRELGAQPAAEDD